MDSSKTVEESPVDRKESEGKAEQVSSLSKPFLASKLNAEVCSTACNFSECDEASPYLMDAIRMCLYVVCGLCRYMHTSTYVKSTQLQFLYLHVCGTCTCMLQ